MKSWKAPLVATFALFVFGAGGACSTKANEGGSETNWLCEVDADCDAGQCVCGKCADTCDPTATCTTGRNPCAVTVDGGGGGSAGSGGSGGGAGSGNDAGGAAPDAGSVQFTTHTTFTDLLVRDMAPDEGPLGRCLPRPLPVGGSGDVPCKVVSAISTDGGCGCDGPGYSTPSPAVVQTTLARLREAGTCDATGAPACDSLCLCELSQLHGACQSSTTLSASPAGFCYVDPATGGNPTLVGSCDVTQRRILRLTPDLPKGSYAIVCDLARTDRAPIVGTPAALGASCVPRDEYRTDFNGFVPTEVSVDVGSPACESGLCLVDQFAGRTTCPYGQKGTSTGGVDPSIPESERCRTPAPDSALVTVPVIQQKQIRPPDTAVYCSCRCDGPDPSVTYCQCPSGFECTPLVPAVGFSDELPGSFCTKIGDRPPASGDFGTDCWLPAADRPIGCGPISQ